MTETKPTAASAGSSALDALNRVLGGGASAPAKAAASANATPSTGRRGNRMLSPNVDVQTLDRSAPRGTYVDILV